MRTHFRIFAFFAFLQRIFLPKNAFLYFRGLFRPFSSFDAKYMVDLWSIFWLRLQNGRNCVYTNWQEGWILAVNAFFFFFCILLHYSAFCIAFFLEKNVFFPALSQGLKGLGAGEGLSVILYGRLFPWTTVFTWEHCVDFSAGFLGVNSVWFWSRRRERRGAWTDLFSFLSFPFGFPQKDSAGVCGRLLPFGHGFYLAVLCGFFYMTYWSERCFWHDTFDKKSWRRGRECILLWFSRSSWRKLLNKFARITWRKTLWGSSFADRQGSWRRAQEKG